MVPRVAKNQGLKHSQRSFTPLGASLEARGAWPYKGDAPWEVADDAQGWQTSREPRATLLGREASAAWAPLAASWIQLVESTGHPARLQPEARVRFKKDTSKHERVPGRCPEGEGSTNRRNDGELDLEERWPRGEPHHRLQKKTDGY